MAYLHPPERPITERQPAVERIALIAWVVLAAALTLRPGNPANLAGPFLCFPCGTFGGADAVLNVLFFVPPGVLLARGGWSPLRVGLAALATSGAIELAQVALPGRFPTAADLLSNTLGAILGAAVVRWGLRRAPHPVALALSGAGVLAVTVGLAAPSIPADALFGLHTPQLGWVPAYEGRIVEASVAGVAVPSGPVPDDAALRRALEVERLEVRFEVGPVPAVRARTPVFAVFDASQEEAVQLWTRGRDLGVRFGTVAHRLRFHRPSAILPGALDGVAPGSTVTLGSWPERGGRCVRLEGRVACGLGVDPTGGWRFLIGADHWSPLFAWVVSVVWVAVPLLLIAWTPAGEGARALAAAGLLILAAVLPTLSLLASIHWGPLIAGSMLGGAGGLALRKSGVGFPSSGGRIG